LAGANEAWLAPFVDENLHFEDLLPIDGATPDEVAETLELEERIDRALAEHPPVVRSVFLLSTLENLTLAQVAQSLRINEEAVRRHLDEAREAVLREVEQTSPSWRRILSIGAGRMGPEA
jgi:RNA polymerase sigma factor (sigma-70 family)